MFSRTLRCCAVVILFTFMGAATVRGQAAVEYGGLASSSAGAVASVGRAVPATGLPGGSSSGSAGSASSPATPSPEAVAKSSRLFFQSHSGTDAAQITLRTVPDHSQAWIDGKYVGPTPLDLKLAPGHHQFLLRATNMQDSTREFDLSAKQTQTLDVTLKAGYRDPSQVTLRWPAHK